MIPIVLTIAGSDSSGGAGIQADLKAIAACGGHGASVITAITAQNTLGIARVEALSADLVEAQMEAVFSDLRLGAVKTGMLGTAEVVSAVVSFFRRFGPVPYVCDPVMSSTTGYPLLSPQAVDILRRDLLPLATLVTPNVHEAELLTGLPVETLDQAETAARRLIDIGARAVLVKGGHLRERPATDVLVTRTACRTFAGEHVKSPHTHGTGCVYSAAIATFLAHGLDLPESITRAKELITEAIRHGIPAGAGAGPVDPLFLLRAGPRGAGK